MSRRITVADHELWQSTHTPPHLDDIDLEEIPLINPAQRKGQAEVDRLMKILDEVREERRRACH